MQARHGRHRPGDGHPAQLLRQQAAGRLHVLGIDADVEKLAQFLHRQPGGDPGMLPFLDPLHRRLLLVIFVGDLPDDLLQDVLDGDESRGPAVLVDHDREMNLQRLHLLEQLVNRLALGHEGGRPHDRGDLLDGLALTVQLAPGRDVLEVDDPDHVVQVLADHRNAGEAAAQGKRQRLAQRLVPFDEHHVGARDHDLPHDRVAQLEHRVDHRALTGLDDLPLLQQVDKPAQVLLGSGRPPAGPRLTAGRPEKARQRPEEAHHRMQDGRRGECHPRRVPLGAAGHQHGSHVDRHDNDRGGDRERPPAGADHVQQHHGHQDGRARLGCHPRQ